MKSKERPYVLFVAEEIYSNICEIKKKNPDLSNIDAIESFIGSKKYKRTQKLNIREYQKCKLIYLKKQRKPVLVYL